jgi:murein L,D-transpeptidase YcbB/YkuD
MVVSLACAGDIAHNNTAPQTPPVKGPTATDQATDTLHAIVAAGRLDGLRWPDFSDYRVHLFSLYDQQGWRLLWTDAGRPTVQAREAVAHLARADASGLRAEDYDAASLAKQLDGVGPKTSPSDLARFDAGLSVALMRNISDLHIGRVNPEKAGFQLDVGPKKYDLPQLVGELARSNAVTATLARVEPPYQRYAWLKQALARYRALAADRSLVPPPDLAPLKPGAHNAGIPTLRRWLEALGDAPPASLTTARSDLYEGDVVEAVKRFQVRHGYTPDGVIGAATSQALRVPLAQRVRQVELSLERWRWVPESFESPPIVVNIPEFRLHVFARDARGTLDEAFSMRVIVGNALKTQTPVFSGEMEYVVFRPYWNVPYSIVKNEMLAKLRRDPRYLAKERLEIVSGAGTTQSVNSTTLAGLASGALGIRQRPGPDNSLGLAKFVFPNDESVYLHGTPAQSLFARQRRDFSHGCIRVEDPVALAEFVLRGLPGWNREHVEAAMHAGATSQVDLPAPIPVYVVYVTAVAQSGREVGFFEDLYGHDAELERLLAAGYPYPW